MNFTITKLDAFAEHEPIPAECTFDFSTVIDACTIAIYHEGYEMSHHYTRDNEHGYINTTITCFNLISSTSMLFPIYIREEIGNGTIEPVHPYFETGTVANFSLTIPRGSHVQVIFVITGMISRKMALILLSIG